MSQTTPLTYSRVTNDVVRMLDKPTFKWWALFLIAVSFVGIGLICFVYQVYTGLGVAGYRHPRFLGYIYYRFCFLGWYCSLRNVDFCNSISF